MNTLEQINEIIKEATKKDIQVTQDSDLIADHLLDSLDTMVFFMLIKEKFKANIPQEMDLHDEDCYKIKNLIALIESKK